jgi:hypothetical protein
MTRTTEERTDPPASTAPPPSPPPMKASRRLVFAVDQKLPDGTVKTSLVYAKGRGGALKHASAAVFTARRPSPTEVADMLTSGAKIDQAKD